jgi:hypothetical protein
MRPFYAIMYSARMPMSLVNTTWATGLISSRRLRKNAVQHLVEGQLTPKVIQRLIKDGAWAARDRNAHHSLADLATQAFQPREAFRRRV